LVVTLASLTPELGQAGPDPQRQGAESNDPKIQDAGRRSSPGIEFAATAFDFGKILSGLPIKHEFVFTNTGTVPLEITEVKPGCGCTTAGAWDRIVNPGRTGKIPLQLNLAAFSGPFAKSATVTCNDPTQTNVVLQLLGTVWKPIEIIPPTAVFTVSTEAPTNETKVLRILSNFSEPIVLSDVQCTNDAFRAELKTVQPGKEFELHITVAPPLSSASAFTAVMMKTSSSQIPQISASIYATLQPVLTMSPQALRSTITEPTFWNYRKLGWTRRMSRSACENHSQAGCSRSRLASRQGSKFRRRNNWSSASNPIIRSSH
jgi:hypothetical protein